MPPILAQFEVD